MATYVYPSSDFDKSRNLLALLGTHWNDIYAGNFFIEKYAFARAQEEIQAFQDLLETVASLSRFEVPIFHTDNWYLLTLSQSDLNAQLLKYGDGANYGNNSGITYEYGEAKPVTDHTYIFTLPTELVETKLILNRITEPSRVLVSGVDYVIPGDGTIRFRVNPFEDSAFPTRDVFSGSDVVDTEVGLWVFRGQFDWQHVYTHFGYVLGLHLQSSDNYKDFVNAILDALVEGSSAKHVQLALAAVTGVPLVIEPEETVELVQTDHAHLVIATDSHVYKFHPDSTALVNVGDTVYAGDPLVDTVRIFDLNVGETPSELSAVTMGIGFLPGEYVDGLTFRNTDVPLVVTADQGRTKVTFEIGGFPTDIEQFWQTVHDRGVANGTTLANYLDVRGSSPPTETQAVNLPETINPLAFLISNILRYNAFVVKLKTNLTDSKITLSNTRLFRKIVPPWTAVLIILELETSDNPVIMEDAGNSTTPGYTEDVSKFTGMGLKADTIDAPTYITEIASLHNVSGICT